MPEQHDSHRAISRETIVRGKMRGFFPASLEFARHYAPTIAAAIMRQHEATRPRVRTPPLSLESAVWIGAKGIDLENAVNSHV